MVVESLLLAGLRQEIVSVLDEQLAGVGSVAVVDYPFHTNAGDSLMWLGSCDVLGHLKKRVVASSHREAADRLNFADLSSDVAVLIQGGGNFGDLWPEHQEHRIRLIQEQHERLIIQLPQSFHFSDESELVKTQMALAGRGNVVLMWRDNVSLAKGRLAFPSTVHVRSPDIAFGVTEVGGGLVQRGQGQARVVVLARNDHEGSALRDWFPESCRTDWHLSQAGRVDWFLVSRTVGRGLLPLPLKQQLVVYDRLARQNVKAAIGVLRDASIVLTDRLHCMILCEMLGIRSIVVGDFHGKVKALYDTWLSDSRLCTWAGTPEAAADLMAAQGL